MSQQQTNRSITQGWVAGFILGLVMGLENLFYATGMWWKVIVVLGLTIGIYRRSRLAALLLFGYFGVEKALAYQELIQTPFNIVFTLVIGLGLVKGIIGTFRYHNSATRSNQVL